MSKSSCEDLLPKLNEMLEAAENAETIAWKNQRTTTAFIANGRKIAYKAVIELIKTRLSNEKIQEANR